MAVNKGAPPDRQALAERIAAWERIVAQIEAGYRFDLDDWLNDMDLRHGIGGPTDGGPLDKALADRLAACDLRYLRATAAAGKCLWGAAAAAREGWHADRHWWYFRRPRQGNPELGQEIDSVT